MSNSRFGYEDEDDMAGITIQPANVDVNSPTIAGTVIEIKENKESK